MINASKIIYLLFFFSISTSYVNGQGVKENSYGINGSISIAIGNQFDRIGFRISAYYVKDFFQVNPGLSMFFNFKALGPEKQYLESIASLGVIFGYGKKNAAPNYFYTSVSNQTNLKNSIGYAFNYYFNDIGTSQQTGIFSFQFNHFSLLAENDLFARPKLDRYRTGAFLLQYRKDEIQLGINTTLFTGQMGKKITDPNYPYSHIYKDTIGGQYTPYSHGLLSFQFQYANSNYQTLQSNIGLDAEEIRHAIQNRFIHDMIFLPKAWRKSSSAHIPMIDSEGNQFLFKKKSTSETSIFLL